MADKLDFQCFDLLIERKIPEKDAFVGLENFEATLESDNCINEVKVFFEENYIWLIGNKGRSKPYSSQVYDTTTKATMAMFLIFLNLTTRLLKTILVKPKPLRNTPKKISVLGGSN